MRSSNIHVTACESSPLCNPSERAAHLPVKCPMHRSNVYCSRGSISYVFRPGRTKQRISTESSQSHAPPKSPAKALRRKATIWPFTRGPCRTHHATPVTQVALRKRHDEALQERWRSPSHTQIMRGSRSDRRGTEPSSGGPDRQIFGHVGLQCGSRLELCLCPHVESA